MGTVTARLGAGLVQGYDLGEGVLQLMAHALRFEDDWALSTVVFAAEREQQHALDVFIAGLVDRVDFGQHQQESIQHAIFIPVERFPVFVLSLVFSTLLNYVRILFAQVDSLE